MFKYIPDNHLPKLKEYQYRGLDISPFTKYVLQPYWTYCLRFVPIWLAPNAVTLIGFAAVVLSYLSTLYYAPWFGPGALTPGWVYLFAAVALEFYSLMDNLDGKQARRTGTSSPLGELFDHGCDCIANVLLFLVSCVIAQINDVYALALFLGVTFSFWLATWEEYHTGILFLGFVNGPSEGIQMLSLTFFLTYLFGGEFWTYSVSKLFGFEVPFIGNESFNVVYAVLLVTPSLITLFFNVRSVTRDAIKRGKSTIKPWKEIILFLFVSFFIVVTYYYSRESWNKYPHLFYLTVGLCVAELTHRLILAHITKQNYSLFQRPILFIILLAANVSFKYFGREPPVDEVICAAGLLVVQLLLFSHYTVVVINQICGYLGIRCLKIPNKKD